MTGWIKLHRKMLDWEWYSSPSVARVFMHLLLTASFEDEKWRGKTIKRGELITTIADLSKETGLSVKSVRLALTKLQKGKQIVTKGTNKNTLIAIVKYEEYQSNENERANKGRTKGQTPINIDEEEKNKKNKQKKKNWFFEGKIIQISFEMAENWKSSYANLDLLTVLKEIDQNLHKEGYYRGDSRWFSDTLSKLKELNLKMKSNPGIAINRVPSGSGGEK